MVWAYIGCCFFLQNLGPLGLHPLGMESVADSLKRRSSLRGFACWNWSLWSYGTSIHTEICEKNWTPRISESLKIIKIDMDGSDTYDFVYNVLVIHSSYTIFHKKTTPYLIGHNFGKCWSIFKFFHPRTQQRSCNELIIKDPSLLKGVDTLPCEM